jgi:hypothetical protein
LLPVSGNHDYHWFLIQFCTQRITPGPVRARFPWLAPGLPYAVPYGELLLLFIDSETALDMQAAWLRSTLAASAQDFDAALIFFHRPPFSNSIDFGAKGDADIQRYIVPVISESLLPVVVFNGHIHGYEHLIVDGRDYVTTAGGGGPRGLLGSERPGDRYQGRDCRRLADGAVLRPLNYVLLAKTGRLLDIQVRGSCHGDAAVQELDRFQVELPGD